MREIIKDIAIRYTVIAILCVHALLISYIAMTTTITKTEISHFGAIEYYWDFGYFDVFHSNPPLTRIIAGIPHYFFSNCDHFAHWSSYSRIPQKHCELDIGYSVMKSYVSYTLLESLFLARCAIIPIIMLGGYFGFRFARELYGVFAGFTFLTLWFFSPLLMGWSATICNDAAAASIGTIAFYTFWRWFDTPTPVKTFFAGLMLALLPYTKLTWIVAFPILLLLYGIRRYCYKAMPIPSGKNLCTVLAFAILLLNAGYAFDGSFRLLKNYHFISGAMTGDYVADRNDAEFGNRFEDSILGYIPVPLPCEFVKGIDTQKLDFECGITSYANGHFSQHGWYWYYLYALLLKEPIGVWLLAFGSVINYKYRKWLSWNSIMLLLPAVFLFVFISSNSGFSCHTRYILPVLPFVYIFISGYGCESKILYAKSAVVCCVLAVAVSSIASYPHSIAHFNFINDANKHKYLLGSNLDWGQSGHEISDWCATHPEARPRYVSYTNTMPFEKLLIKDDGWMPETRKAGWMSISANDIHSKQYSWLLQETPVEILGGGSVLIYHIPEFSERDR